VRQTLRRSVIIGFLASFISSVALVLTGPWIIGAWTSKAIDPPLNLLVGAAVWAILSTTFNALAIVLNAASVLAFQVKIAVVMAIVSVFLSVFLARLIGVGGVIWGTVVAYVFCAAIPYVVRLPALLTVAMRSDDTASV
jgi:hypothetical protein